MKKPVFLLLVLVSKSTLAQVSVVPDNQFEVRVGWEVYRAMPGGVVGYVVYELKNWSFVPEISVVAGPTLSGSFRYEHGFETGLVPYGQAGFGFTFVLGPAPTGVFAIGIKYRLKGNMFLCGETRMMLISAGAIGVAGRNLQDFPPWLFSLGLAF